jgi:SPP1 gp7 family putative phage head morphogenesis protein
VTSTAIPTTDTIRAALRKGAGRWIARFYRHELLVARTVRGMQVEAIEEFRREVVQPVLRAVGARLATFTPRGLDLVAAAYPELRTLMAEIEAVVARGSDAVRRLTTERLAELVKQEVGWVRESAAKTMRVDPPPVNERLVVEAVQARPVLGEPVEKWFGKMLVGPTGDKTRAWIQTGLSENLTTDQIIRGLRGSRASDYSDGILSGQSASAVGTLVRTAATHASSIARTESFKAIGVTSYRWISTLDSKTSIICASRDGEVYELGKGPMPPAHPNCRSTTVPDFGGEPIGTRAAVDGPVPADMTFRSWLQAQGRDVQDEVLGKTRATAWRGGRLTFEKMLGADMQPLTLAELRRLDRIPDEEP